MWRVVAARASAALSGRAPSQSGAWCRVAAVSVSDWGGSGWVPGAWAAGRYRFMQRHRSGMEHNRGEEFDAPFACIDRMGPDRFDIYWMRHTGKWWRLHIGMMLAEALRILETDGVLHPV